MSEPVPFEAWLERVCRRPLPTNPIVRIRTAAKELAEGAAENHWRIYLYTFRGELTTDQTELTTYMDKRWSGDFPGFDLLRTNQYVTPYSDGSDTLVITRQAFDLLETAEPANIFISYKRSESSAFALLVLARLKQAGLEPFLDLALVPGEDWEKALRERIQHYQYLVALIGPDTLKSEVCLKEIAWASEAGLTIIPVWHNGFTYRSADWSLAPALDKALSKTHTIRVIEESALGYNNALVELLNRFGVTP